MCGIVGYVGKGNNAIKIALNGLKQLEYRGYDSAGIVALSKKDSSSNKDASIFLKKRVGRVAELKRTIGEQKFSSSCAIAHTRWATHGPPSLKNTHPHFDCQKKIFLVHNGIIENYKFLKEALLREGHQFVSTTDTEVLAHLIERHFKGVSSIEDAVLDALYHIKGTFAIAVLTKDEPDKVIVARRSSPLIIGIGRGEYFVASDVSAITSHTKHVVYLDDDEVAVLSPSGFSIFDFKKRGKRKPINLIEWDTEEAQKEGFSHFMAKEIYKQPETIKDSIRGRLVEKEGVVKLGGLEVLGNQLDRVARIVITACGTAYYAGMVGKYLLENLAKMPTEVYLASELRYQNQILDKNTAVLAISQSGETADTLASLRLANIKGNITLGIVNVVGSSVARETDAGVYNHIGPEIGVASTKAFTSQLVILVLFAIFFGRRRSVLSKSKARELIRNIHLLPPKIKQILKTGKRVETIAQKYKQYKNFLYLGRKYNYPIALEGALKLKEISYLHAEGYAAGEMKHGPIALIDKNFPIVAVLGPADSKVYSKMLSNLEEIKARGGPILAVAEEGDSLIKELADDVLYVPRIPECLSPILNVIPLHLLAYHIGVMRGCDVDKPRNLAKSVTVE
jgi:glucosamine--fructose-6-phosphate aminotransferase (isomerizing)